MKVILCDFSKFDDNSKKLARHCQQRVAKLKENFLNFKFFYLDIQEERLAYLFSGKKPIL